MNSRLKTFFFSGDRQYVTLRGVAALMALVFALIYSKQLGVERRGILTFVMMTNLVMSILLISGISLHLRNISRINVNREVVGTYLFVVPLLSCITSLLNILVLELYELIYQTQIPRNLTFVCAMYCFFATLSYGIQDALLLVKSIKVAAVMDLGVILMQIIGYLTLIYVGETSYFVSVLISISVSYLVMASGSLLLIIHIHNPKIVISVTSLKQLISDSSSSTLINLASQLLERVDKVFIGLQTSSADLGRYSTSQSIIGITRFVPEALSKLTVARNVNFLVFDKARQRNLVLFLSLAIFAGFSMYLLVVSVLGAEWRISLTILFFMLMLEILRGFYSLLLMNAVKYGAFSKLRKSTILQLLIGVIAQPIAIHISGLFGSVICSLLIVIVGIRTLRQYLYV